MKQLNQLQKEIKDKQPPLLNIWTGEEYAIQQLYQNKIIELAYTKVVCETVAEVFKAMQVKSFIKSKKLYIVYDDNDFIKAEKQWQRLKAFNDNNTIIILKYQSIDKRSKFYKAFENDIVSFDKIDNDVLLRHTMKLLPQLDDKSAQKLIDVCESNWGRIQLESDKITNSKSNLNDLLKDGTITEPIGDITFKLTDNIVYGDIDNTQKYLEQALIKEEPTLMILSILYNQFRQMLLVQGLGKDKKNAAEKTGLTTWQVKQVMEKIGGYKTQELVKALKVIRDIEVGIKTGKIQEEIALEYCIIKVMI